MLVPGLNRTLDHFLKQFGPQNEFHSAKNEQKVYSWLILTISLQLIIISQVLLVNCFIHKL